MKSFREKINRIEEKHRRQKRSTTKKLLIMMAHDLHIIVISYVKRSPTVVVWVMNYTQNHKEEKSSDVASAPEVFAHPVTPHIQKGVLLTGTGLLSK